MAFQLSPGVNVSEVDLTTYVPSVSSTVGAFVGKFSWGPVNEIVTVDQESKLVERFGKPTDDNYEYWFTAANFLAYANSLRVVRAANTSANNATSKRYSINSLTIAAGGTGYSNGFINVVASGPAAVNANVQIITSNVFSGAPANTWANGTIVGTSVISGGLFYSTPTIPLSDLGGANGSVTVTVTAETGTTEGRFIRIENESDYDQNHASGANTIFAAKYPGTLGNSLKVELVDANSWASWSSTYDGFFTDAPATSDYAANRGASNDELHVIVVDLQGKISGTANTILEKFAFLSKASDAKNSDGSSNYYKDVLKNRSRYIWLLEHPGVSATGNAWGTAVESGKVYANTTGLVVSEFANGSEGEILDGDLTVGLDNFVNADNIDVSLIITGPANTPVQIHAINNVAEVRKDCVVFVSPQKDSVVDNYGQETANAKSDATAIGSSTYAFMDSGWKYQYDKFNDTYRWIPLNGDIAGLTARSDQARDPWYSPAGLSRGVIKNVIKLAWNPSKADRDDLYAKGINPVVNFTGEGTILYGDKTLTSRPTAFDRINVRRLFIVLQKAISVASRSTLFEFNDQFTRAQFVALVEPYLRDVQGRRGIYDFRVVCDETNNTPEVIDRNEFVGDIYIKPARSVNFIQLNFVAVRTGVSFNEIVGQF